MRIHLPPVWAIENLSSCGLVRCLARPGEVVDGTVCVRYTKDKDHGYILTIANQDDPIYLFRKNPASSGFGTNDRVIVSPGEPVKGAPEFDLSSATWWKHPGRAEPDVQAVDLATAARRSWRHAFQFQEEAPGDGVVGLRKPQIGALHAIHAHWATDTQTATIVMPTGTGKTETMLSVLTSADCERVVVVVPTDALRSQIAQKFESLGVLKHPSSRVLGPVTKRPVVGTMTSKPKSAAEANGFMQSCNVVVMTSQLAGGSTPEVQEALAALASHLFIDEAHHAEAPTWRRFRDRFSGKPVLQFTATPFREDDQKIDGKLIFVYLRHSARSDLQCVAMYRLAGVSGGSS